MTIEQFLAKEPGESASVFNEPFTHVGHAIITLKGGQEMRWLYDDGDERMISVVADEDELVLFEKIQELIEAEDDAVLYQNKEYEFTYADAGMVTEVVGESVTEVKDKYTFTDYEAQNGELIRIINNENTGENSAYLGRVVGEDDFSEL